MYPPPTAHRLTRAQLPRVAVPRRAPAAARRAALPPRPHGRQRPAELQPRRAAAGARTGPPAEQLLRARGLAAATFSHDPPPTHCLPCLNPPTATSKTKTPKQIANLSRAHDWRRRFNISVGGYGEVQGDYSELLARSVFCLVAAGDGWSARFDDAVLHGCIPVIVIDGVVGPWGHQLRWRAFSVRVREADVARLPEILLAIPPARVARMQRALAGVWRRFAWLSHPWLLRQARELQAVNERARRRLLEGRADGGGGGGGGGGGNSSAAADEADAAAMEAARPPWLRGLRRGEWRDDAFGSVVQWLHHKLRQREAAAAGAGGGAPDGGGGGAAGAGAAEARFHRPPRTRIKQHRRWRQRARRDDGGGVGEV